MAAFCVRKFVYKKEKKKIIIYVFCENGFVILVSVSSSFTQIYIQFLSKVERRKKNKKTQIFSCDDSTIAARNIVGVVYKS